MTYAATVLADSPSVYYRLGDSAAPAVPNSGLGVNLAATGSPTFGQAGALAGDGDTAVKFSATNTDYLQTAATPGAAYDLGDGSFSIEFWYKLASAGVTQTPISKGGTCYLARINSSNHWILRSATLTDVFVTTAAFADTAGWHHVVMTRVAATQPHIYVDGVDQAGTYTAGTFSNTTNAFTLGIDTGSVGPFTGSLDEVALYKSVLTQAQVTAHYLAGTTIPGAVGYAQPGRTWLRRFHHPQRVMQAALAQATAPPAAAVFPAAPLRPGPHRARLGACGALAAGILATGIGPPAVRAPHQPPAVAHPAPHRALWHGGAGAAPNARQQAHVPPVFALRVPHRAVWDGIAGPVAVAVPASGARPVTVFRRTPHGALWRSAAGAPPAARPQPFTPKTVYPRAPHRASWRGGTGAVAIAGTLQPSRPVTVYARRPHGALWRGGRGVPPAAQLQPSRPLTVWSRPGRRAIWDGIAGPVAAAVPAQSLRPVTVYRRVAHGATWRAIRGTPPAAARQPFRPATVFSRVPHRASWQQGHGAPPAARKQPFRPATVYARRPHGAIWRRVTGAAAVVIPPPPFTVGQLTAQTAATGTLTAVDAPGGSGYGALYGPAYPGGAEVTLTAADKPAGTLAGGTAPGSTQSTGTQRTGGPGG